MQHEKMLRNATEKNIKQQISNFYNALRKWKETMRPFVDLAQRIEMVEFL